MAGVRFLAASILLLHFASCADTNFPATSATQCRADWPVMVAVGNGMVTVAEHQNVPSGIAVMVVTVPLYPVLSRLFGIKTRKLEWVDRHWACGIIMPNSGGNLRAIRGARF